MALVMPVKERVIIVSQEGQSKELCGFLPGPRTTRRHSTADLGPDNFFSTFFHGHGREKSMELHGYVMTAIAVKTQYDFVQNPFQVC